MILNVVNEAKRPFVLKDLSIQHKATYKLAKPIAKHALSVLDRTRIDMAYGSDTTGKPVYVTTYPAGKRRERAVKGAWQPEKYRKASLVAAGSPTSAKRMKLGDGMRQANWDAFGPGRINAKGYSAKLEGRELYDSLDTSPYRKPDAHTFRFDQGPKAYAYPEHAPDPYELSDNVIVKGGRRIQVERRSPGQRKRGLQIPDTGLSC